MTPPPAHSQETLAIIEAVHEATAKLEQRITTMQARQDRIIAGFPGGDPESHRRYHETVIEWRELRNKMVREALIHAAKVGGLAGACWIAYAVWMALKMEIMK